MSFEKCNCGKEVRYEHIVDGERVGSCNKHVVCPPYDELRLLANLRRIDTVRLLSAAQDLLEYREGTQKYQMAKYLIDNFEPSKVEELE